MRQSISSLANEPNSEVFGVYRACSPSCRVAKNQSAYQVMRLVDATGQINGYAWSNTYKGNYFPQNNDIVRINGKTKICPTNGSVIVDIRAAEPVPSTGENPIALMNMSKDANSDDISELIRVMDEITSPSLRIFLNQVFSNDALAKTYVIGKGSTTHHHAFTGGLLRHSLECVRIISRFNELPLHEREVGIVAALLHDITKTKCFYNVKGYSPPMLNHDSRSLEMLSEPLRVLEEHWLDGAGLLRMALEYPYMKKEYLYRKHHVPAIIDLVWFADQLSTALDKERSVYSISKEWQRYIKHENVSYWRSTADNFMELKNAA